MPNADSVRTAHLDTFARDRLPPPEALPDFLFDGPGLQFPPRLNCAVELLQRRVIADPADAATRRCLIAADGTLWTYADLLAQASRIAHVLVQDMGLVPGNRVLLRAANQPMLVACWMAVMLAGGIAVGTMPMLRAQELCRIIDKAQISHALCDGALADELAQAGSASPWLRELRHFGAAAQPGGPSLEALAAARPAQFSAVNTAAEDVALLAFTSGTTGLPKATMHNHRDLMAACACFPPHVLRATADDLFIGSPPLAFTFGLGGLLLFPLSVGAATVLLDKTSAPDLLAGVLRFGATLLLTAPTFYRAMADAARAARVSTGQGGTLRKCVSAGEALPAATRALWRQATGIELIDGIGATEMLHIFISADEQNARAGATGQVVPGYQACVMDPALRPLPPGQVGRLAVKGPTGCRYLDDPQRQAAYVQGGWNLTGDAYRMDEDGYFWFQARTDDMIVSAGYNIAGPEVEDALLRHPAVAECAVIGVPDAQRGQLVKAYVVLKPGLAADATMLRGLQDFVKASIAPYKYPRAIEFRSSLPRTATGKLQRFRLRDGP